VGHAAILTASQEPLTSAADVSVCSSISPAERPLVSWLIILVVYALLVAGWWMIFTKAGEDGWKALIPIWNTLIILKIVGREWWWIILMIIPIVGLIVWIIVALDLAKSFGRGTGFGIGLIIFPYIWSLILGFGSDTYKGPAASAPATA
jgi:hypothetical protein